MTDGRAAARAERLRVAHPVALQRGLRHGVGLHRGPDRGVARRKTTDLSGRVSCSARAAPATATARRRCCRIRSRIVGRQQRARRPRAPGIPHGVGVLGAVQPLDDGPSGIRVRRCGRRAPPRCVRRPRHTSTDPAAADRPAASCGFAVARRPFPGSGICGDVVEIERVERQIRGQAPGCGR